MSTVVLGTQITHTLLLCVAVRKAARKFRRKPEIARRRLSYYGQPPDSVEGMDEVGGGSPLILNAREFRKGTRINSRICDITHYF